MKTISQLSKDLNVSPQALYKKINKQLFNQLHNHIHEGIKGQKLIDTEGEKIIAESLSTYFSTNNQNVDSNHIKTVELVEVLKGQVEDLQKRLDTTQNQITQLTDTIKEQQQANNQQIYNLQVLLKQEQAKNTLLLDSVDGKKNSLWDKLFKKKKDIINQPSPSNETNIN